LTKKLAAVLNGVDVSTLREGDIVDLTDSAARMLIAERWAEPANESVIVPTLASEQSRSSRMTDN